MPGSIIPGSIIARRCDPVSLRSDVQVESMASAWQKPAGGLGFVNFGQRSFLAVDLETREGIGFIAERLVESESKLHGRSIFDTLFCMSIGGRGLVPSAQHA